MLGRWDRWKFYLGEDEGWRWTRYGSGARIVGRSSEGYVRRSDCEANARRLGWGLRAWPPSNGRDRWKFYRDTEGRWRWRRIAGNNRIVGAAHRGFASLAECRRNARRFGWVVEAEGEPRAPSGEWRRCASTLAD